jgi:hypothetical protein
MIRPRRLCLNGPALGAAVFSELDGGSTVIVAELQAPASVPTGTVTLGIATVYFAYQYAGGPRTVQIWRSE